MLGELNEMQIDHFLLSQAVGRIACTDGKIPYIVPVTYVYDGKDIIIQSNLGKKIEIMRQNKNVCFEVDAMDNMANWRSVIVRGTFQELKGESAKTSREYFLNYLWPYMTSGTVHPHEHRASDQLVDDSNRIKTIMIRIKVIEKSGRFEKQ